jgi:hypothetical protein
MNKTSYVFYLVLCVLTACNTQTEYTETKEAVIGKTVKEFTDKEPIYRIAFSSGFDRKVTFGDYCRFNQGDSVVIKYYNGFTTIK